jgi:hypothetical protein
MKFQRDEALLQVSKHLSLDVNSVDSKESLALKLPRQTRRIVDGVVPPRSISSLPRKNYFSLS